MSEKSYADVEPRRHDYDKTYVVQQTTSGWILSEWKKPYNWPGKAIATFLREQEADACAQRLTDAALAVIEAQKAPMGPKLRLHRRADYKGPAVAPQKPKRDHVYKRSRDGKTYTKAQRGLMDRELHSRTG
jgi:hypothetical protein